MDHCEWITWTSYPLTTTLDFWVILHFEAVAILDVEPGEASSMETWSLWIVGLAFLVFLPWIFYLSFALVANRIWTSNLGMTTTLCEPCLQLPKKICNNYMFIQKHTDARSKFKESSKHSMYKIDVHPCEA